MTHLLQNDSKAVGAWLKCAKLQVESTSKPQTSSYFPISFAYKHNTIH